MNLTESELDILRILRQLVPFEEIRIMKDQLGRDDHFIITRTQKIVLSKDKRGPVSLK